MQSSSVAISIQQLLDRYAAGEYTLARRAQLDSLLRELRGGGVGWVQAEGAAAEPRRRLIAASLALEAAGNRLYEWSTAKELIELGCGLVRDAPAPFEGERVWHLASIALAHGLYDSSFLIHHPDRRDRPNPVGHLDHATQRFPDEDRLLLARAIAYEAETWPEPENRARNRSHRRKLLELVRRFEPLVTRSGVAAEARLRLGHTHLRLAQPEVALTHLRQAGLIADETFLNYAAAYLTGRAHEAAGDRPAAAAAYRHALTIVPRAQSASMALASLLFTGEQRDDAFDVVESAVSAAQPAIDPWRMYATGDYRFWPALIERLHKGFK